MRRDYPPEIQKENDKIIELLLNCNDEFIDIDKFINEHASQEYLSFMKKYDDEVEEAFKQGIIIE